LWGAKTDASRVFPNGKDENKFNPGRSKKEKKRGFKRFLRMEKEKTFPNKGHQVVLIHKK